MGQMIKFIYSHLEGLITLPDMETNELDYDLPEHLIAQHPAHRRCQSRLMVLHRQTGTLEHRQFTDLAEYLCSGDCLAINNTKVIPARFYLRRSTGGQIEGLFLNLNRDNSWHVLLKNASRLKEQETLTLIGPSPEDKSPQTVTLTIQENQGRGHWHIKPNSADSYLDILNQYGFTPLPPYIRRDPHQLGDQVDRSGYQTIYAHVTGSIAAPTAGLHFTSELLDQLQANSIDIARLTLHVGLGTFKPVTAQKLEDHIMHSEHYHLDQNNADVINKTLVNGHRVIAVGTTSLRTIETLADNTRVRPGTGQTDLFITPGHQFRITKALLTNFHLPRSTLLALVCAFAGTQQALNAYRQAIKLEYRFYSYGDAMLII